MCTSQAWHAAKPKCNEQPNLPHERTAHLLRHRGRAAELTQSFTARSIHVECTRAQALTRTGNEFHREWKVSVNDSSAVFWDVTYFDGNHATVTIGPAQGPGAKQLGNEIIASFASTERACREAGEIS